MTEDKEPLEYEFVVDDPWDIAPAPSIVIVPPVQNPPNLLLAKQDDLRRVEDELLEKAQFTLMAALSFGDLDPTPRVDAKGKPIEPEPPLAWIEELGLEGARRKHRIAMAAWASSKDVPHGIKMAQEVSLGMLTNKSNRQAAPGSLNIGTVNMVIAAPSYPELDVGGDE